MHDTFVITATYVAKSTADQSLLRPPQTGPDATPNIWALK
jgi:hypothetical protein